MSSANTPTSAPAQQTLAAPSGNGRRIHGFALGSVLAALMLTLLLEALDQTIVGTALPKIIAELQGFDRYTWVVTAYLLASTTMIPIVGKLSDQFGRKWFFVAGVILFLVGSALSGAAQTMNQLIVFRAIQGLGAGTGIALVFTVVGDIFPPAERAKWQGIFAAVYGFSSVVGPTIGGWLSDHGPLVGTFVTDTTRWRWVFYVNIPIGIIALLALLIYLPTDISARSSRYRGLAALKRVDFLGAALASGATICLLLGLTWGGNQTYSWNSPQVMGTLAGAAALYLAFFIAERFAVEPILPLDLFRNQVFAADSLLSITSGMVLLSLVIYLPLFLQGVLGESATNSGEVITPLTISLVIGASISGFVIARLGRYHGVTVAGAVVMTIGVFLLTRMTATTSIITAGGYMVVTGLGLGIFFSVMTLAVQNALPRTRMGIGTGAITYLRALGQTLGLAIVGTVVNNTITSDIQSRLPADVKTKLSPQALKFATDTQALVNPTYRDTVVHTAQQFAVHFATLNMPPGTQRDAVAAQVSQQTAALLQQVFAALRQSLATGIQHGFLTVLVFCVGVLVAAVFLKDVPLAKTFREEQSNGTGVQGDVASEYAAPGL
ncbi:MAG: putative MFS-type transporter [Ktedonobacterales bacterium]|jgi:EmrB/QacA subfamily drug resistance transporter|nr:MAG: putative MFS-type transporter [Ktedonobacterales bacterium]